MGKILIALTIIIVTSFSALAQKAQKPNKPVTTKVSPSTGKKYMRRKPVEPPQNFRICKNNSGYYICDEAPGPHNATHPHLTISAIDDKPYVPAGYVQHRNRPGATNPQTKEELTGPESQSYPENIYTVIGVGKPYTSHNYILLGPFDYDMQ